MRFLRFFDEWNYSIILKLPFWTKQSYFFWESLVLDFSGQNDLNHCKLKLSFLVLNFELCIKITTLIVKIDCGAKFFEKSFVLQLISFFKVIRVFSSWLNERPFSYLHCGSIAMHYLFQMHWEYLSNTLWS